MKNQRKIVARLTQENLIKLLENKLIAVDWFNSLAPINESVFADVSMAVLKDAGNTGKTFKTVKNLYQLENNEQVRRETSEALVLTKSSQSKSE
jgi:hypothetical protein